MKRVIAVFAIALMLVSVGTTVGATSVAMPEQDDVEMLYNAEYDFTILERETENKSVVRVYNRGADTTVAAASLATAKSTETVSEAETKALLIALGMEEYFIERLSDEDLQVYANSPQIISTVSYIKTDAQGNSFYVGEEEIELLANDLILPPHVKDDGADGSETEVAITQDSYMKLAFMVSYQANGLYRFSVDARWLTEPVVRKKESIGACAQGFAVVNNSQSGWCKYHAYEERNGVVVADEDREDPLSQFEMVSKEGWDGASAVFSLKYNEYVYPGTPGSMSLTEEKIYTNFQVHYQYDAYVRTPEEVQYFNAMASYDHAYPSIQVDWSIDIAVSGPNLGIGFSLENDHDIRTVQLGEPIQYIPD